MHAGSIDISTSGRQGLLGNLAPKPTSLKDTGLAQTMLEDLLAKLLLETGTADVSLLSRRLALPGAVVESLLMILRTDGRLEVKGPQADSRGLRYSLTDAGKVYAKDALLRSGYVGAAPVSLAVYRELLLAQSVRQHRVTRRDVLDAFAGTTIKPELLTRLGAAMHSGKAIFVYGPPGTGKTYICQKMAGLLGEPVLIPQAVSVGDSIVQVFDALIHHPVRSLQSNDNLLLSEGYDNRLLLCERPFVCSGGELSAGLLEIQTDKSTGQYRAPLQLKASNGIYLIDDLGRQRMPTAELFNRWIVPMESGEDFLNMPSGNRMVVPFDLILIFSTNLNPADLADAAFLRRIGHKIEFDYLDKPTYAAIWKQVCEANGLVFDPTLVDYVIEELHGRSNVPLLACHPRDLLGIAMDYVRFEDESIPLDRKVMDIAWDSNFVSRAQNRNTAMDQLI